MNLWSLFSSMKGYNSSSCQICCFSHSEPLAAFLIILLTFTHYFSTTKKVLFLINFITHKFHYLHRRTYASLLCLLYLLLSLLQRNESDNNNNISCHIFLYCGGLLKQINISQGISTTTQFSSVILFFHCPVIYSSDRIISFHFPFKPNAAFLYLTNLRVLYWNAAPLSARGKYSASSLSVMFTHFVSGSPT